MIVERETYWIKMLNPEYNILKIAYNSKGYKHNNNTKKLLSEQAKLRVHTIDTKNKISN